MAGLEKKEFTDEQLEAIKIVDKLYSLQNDINKAMDYFYQVKKENIFCVIQNKEINGFSNHIPKVFCDLIGMIKNNQLICVNPMQKNKIDEIKNIIEYNDECLKFAVDEKQEKILYSEAINKIKKVLE